MVEDDAVGAALNAIANAGASFEQSLAEIARQQAAVVSAASARLAAAMMIDTREALRPFVADMAETVRLTPVMMTRAFARALATSHGPYALRAGHVDLYRRKYLHLRCQTANRAQYLKALYRVLIRRSRWRQVAQQGPEPLLRYLRKSVHWDALDERRKEEMWARQERGTRNPGRPGKVPDWVATPMFRDVFPRLTKEQRDLGALLEAGVGPAAAIRRLHLGWSVYIALRYKIVGRGKRAA